MYVCVYTYIYIYICCSTHSVSTAAPLYPAICTAIPAWGGCTWVAAMQVAGGRRQDIPLSYPQKLVFYPRIFADFWVPGDSFLRSGGSFLRSGGSFWRPQGSFWRSGRGPGDTLDPSWAPEGLRYGFGSILASILGDVFA